MRSSNLQKPLLLHLATIWPPGSIFLEHFLHAKMRSFFCPIMGLLACIRLVQGQTEIISKILQKAPTCAVSSS